MLEKELNAVIRRSLEREGGFGFKIPDPNQSVFKAGKGVVKNPFDGFGVNASRAVYWEAKIFDGRTFKLGAMRDHQIANLKLIWEMESVELPSRKYLPVIIVGRPVEKKMRCYFILPPTLLQAGAVDLNVMPFTEVRSKELLINWGQSAVPNPALTEILDLLRGQY